MKKSNLFLLRGIYAVVIVIVALVLWLTIQRMSGPPIHIEGGVGQLVFSPNGKFLAVATSIGNFPRPQYVAYVFDVEKCQQVVKFNPGGSACAWNSDGSSFALARIVHPDRSSGLQTRGEPLTIEVWDATTWMLSQTLRIPSISTNISPSIQSLFFDEKNNLFATTHINEFARYNQDSREWADNLLCWRVSTVESGKYSEPAVLVDAGAGVFGAASCTIKGGTRLAISRASLDSPIEIHRMQEHGNGMPSLLLEFTLPAMKYADIRFTPDGRYMVAADFDQFRLYHMLDDHAELLIQTVQQSYLFLGDAWHLVAVSGDSYYVAYTSGIPGKVTVVRTIDGRVEYELENRPSAVAISPDGCLLAAAIKDENGIRFYSIPNARFREMPAKESEVRDHNARD